MGGVSAGRGIYPWWRLDGQELFYLQRSLEISRRFTIRAYPEDLTHADVVVFDADRGRDRVRSLFGRMSIEWVN